MITVIEYRIPQAQSRLVPMLMQIAPQIRLQAPCVPLQHAEGLNPEPQSSTSEAICLPFAAADARGCLKLCHYIFYILIYTYIYDMI